MDRQDYVIEVSHVSKEYQGCAEIVLRTLMKQTQVTVIIR